MLAKLCDGIVYFPDGIMHPAQALELMGEEEFRAMPHDCSDEALEIFIREYSGNLTKL